MKKVKLRELLKAREEKNNTTLMDLALKAQGEKLLEKIDGLIEGAKTRRKKNK